MSCTIYNIKDKKPPFKQDIIVYVTSAENSKVKLPVFAKLWNLIIDENGENYYWKDRDTNAQIDSLIEYWSDYPVFDASKICK